MVASEKPAGRMNRSASPDQSPARAAVSAGASSGVARATSIAAEKRAAVADDANQVAAPG